MLYISQKLGPGVKDSVLKYHNDTTIRLGDICEKQRLSVAETYSSIFSFIYPSVCLLDCLM